MKTILVAGVFDFFHPGHQFFLREAKKCGDFLAVIVARDAGVFQRKGFWPHFSETERLQSVQNSGLADAVFLGKEGDIFSRVREIHPDLLALGYDQKLPTKFEEYFPRVAVIRLPSKNPKQWKSRFFRKEMRTKEK